MNEVLVTTTGRLIGKFLLREEVYLDCLNSSLFKFPLTFDSLRDAQKKGDSYMTISIKHIHDLGKIEVKTGFTSQSEINRFDIIRAIIQKDGPASLRVGKRPHSFEDVVHKFKCPIRAILALTTGKPLKCAIVIWSGKLRLFIYQDAASAGTNHKAKTNSQGVRIPG